MEPYTHNSFQRTSAAARFWFFAAAERPYTLAVSGFILTVITARIISTYKPFFHLQLSNGLHVHHYVLGIFVLAFSGYVSMVLKGPRATFFIALLYGFGLGLTFDEFGIWLKGLDPAYRWSDTGLVIVIAAFIFGWACVFTYKRASMPSEELSRISSENEADASAE